MRGLAILDCERTPDYFPSMVKSANFENWDGLKFLIWSGEKPMHNLEGFNTVVMPKCGTWKAMLSAMNEAIAHRLHSLLLLENDVLFDAGALDFIQKYKIPNDLPFVTFFQGVKEYADKYPHGLTRVPFIRPERGEKPRYSWGQCVLLSHAAMSIAVTSPLTKTWQKPQFGDQFLSQALYPTWTHYGVYSPSLVEHIGDKSSYGWEWKNGEGKRCTNP